MTCKAIISSGIQILGLAFTLASRLHADDLEPVLTASIDESVSVDLCAGWPLLLEIGMIHPEPFASNAPPLLIDPGNGPWSDAVAIEVTDPAGNLQNWPWTLFNVTSNQITLDGTNAGQLVYLLAPSDTALLAPTNYTIRALLNTTNSPNTNSWRGTLAGTDRKSVV